MLPRQWWGTQLGVSHQGSSTIKLLVSLLCKPLCSSRGMQGGDLMVPVPRYVEQGLVSPRAPPERCQQEGRDQALSTADLDLKSSR